MDIYVIGFLVTLSMLSNLSGEEPIQITWIETFQIVSLCLIWPWTLGFYITKLINQTKD